MGGKTIRMSSTKLEALQLQSSAKGVTIPWVRGVTRIPTNLMWANGFKAIEHTTTQSGGKGGGPKISTTDYTYQVSLYLGLCHGPIIDTPRAWVGKGVYGASFNGAQLTTSAASYTLPATGAMTYTIPSPSTLVAVISVEVTLASGDKMMLVDGVDFSRAANVITVLNESLRGLLITITYQSSSAPLTHAALTDIGLTFRAGEIGQAQWSGFSQWPSEGLAYGGFAALAGLNYDLGTSATPPNHTIEVVAPMAYHLSQVVPDVDPSLFLRELLLDQRAGASFPGKFLGDFSRWSTYCRAANLLVSPAIKEQTSASQIIKTAADLTNAVISTTSGKLQILPRGDSVESANGVTYTPNTAPVYDLDDECYVPSSTSASPVKVRLKSNTDRYNSWSLQFLNRLNGYTSEPVDDQDEADIAARGLVANPAAVDAPWICDPNIARKAVRLMLQRSVSVLREYEVPLPPHFSLIDLVDPLTLTDTSLGLNRQPVLVTGIDEDAEGNLTILCEDYPIGSASAPELNGPPDQGYTPNYNVTPGSAPGAVVFEAPYPRTQTGLGIMVAVKSSGDPNWGGAQVWVSMDGTNYRMAGTAYGPARTGTLSEAFGSVSTSLKVTGVTDGQLNSGSALDASNLVTLCYVGGSAPKFLAYQTATLTGAGAYTLGGLVKGAYDSDTATTAPIGTDFVRVDAAVIQSEDLDPSYIGKTIYIKLCSFNIYGGGVQSLADVSPITYTVTGSQYARKGIDYRVVAKGNSDTQSPANAGLYNLGTKAPLVGGARSYVMARIRRTAPYDVTFVQTYDVYGNGALTSGRNAATLAADLNASDNTTIVVVWTYDEPQGNRLTSGLDAAMYRCGASSSVFGSPNFKSRGAYILVGIPGCGQGGGVEMYNGDTDDSTNAWAMLDFHIGPDGYRVTGGSTPRTLRDYSYTGDLNASAGTVLVLWGSGATLQGSTLTMTSSPANWTTAGAYSLDGYTGGAFASAVAGFAPTSGTHGAAIGLNTDPTAGADWTTLDYAIHCQLSGTLYAMESGVATVIGSWAAGDVLAVVYDGVTVKYMKNGTTLRTVSAAAGIKFRCEARTSAACALTNIQFGPMSSVTGIGNSQLVDGAATDVLFDASVSGSIGNGPAGGATSVNSVIRTVSYTNTTGKPIPIQFEGGLTNSTLSWNTSYPTGDTKLIMEWSSATLSGSITLCSRWPASATTDPTISPVSQYQVTLPAGETLTVNLRVKLVHTYAALISWTSSYLRASVIKA